ncbi:MAG: hypothetical protein ACRCZF_20350, partial [Gemmataceae bacterium]
MPRRVGRIVQMQQNSGAGAAVLTNERWRSAAPIISKGRVVFSAFDSDVLSCLDLRTGQLFWSEPRKPGDLYVGGLVDDRVLIVSKDGVRAIQLMGEPSPNLPSGARETVKYAWKDLKTGMPSGHGATLKGGVFYLPLASTPESNLPEVWAIDTKEGKVVDRLTYRRKDSLGESRPMLGNLVFHEGQLFSQSATDLIVFPLVERKTQEMNELLTANPKDPIGLLSKGELLLSQSKWAEALEILRLADKNNPPEAIQERLREKLYQTTTELLRRDFSANENLLTDYEKLLELPIDTDDPNHRQRLVDEQFRRRSLYLCLLAKGREQQGRLAEAFDKYREFATLGGGKQLVAIYDEPNGQTRPDIWARGRIDAMFRKATNPATRKPLEERVEKEWAATRNGNDLNALREFISVFGPYFDAGREAQFVLADQLLKSNNDEQLREAQTILMKLWATA